MDDLRSPECEECEAKYQTLRVPGTMALFTNITRLWHPPGGRSHSISMRPRKSIKHFPPYVFHTYCTLESGINFAESLAQI
jgi:hypothetical protein